MPAASISSSSRAASNGAALRSSVSEISLTVGLPSVRWKGQRDATGARGPAPRETAQGGPCHPAARLAPSDARAKRSRPRETARHRTEDRRQIAQTTCYMCACRCGIDVHLADGRVRHIEGNRDHPVNRGVLCAKGSAGVMQHLSPARLRAPLRRTGPRGSGEFEEITWNEALGLATSLARADPREAPREARLLHRPRPVAVVHRLVGAAVRHPELRRPRRLLLGQHGRRRHLHHGRRLLGVRLARLGAHETPPALRRRRGPRFQPDQDRPRQAQGPRRAGRSRSTRCAPATTPSPTNGSASPPAPTASSSSACPRPAGRGQGRSRLPPALHQRRPPRRPGSRARPASAASCATREGRELVWDRDRHRAVPWEPPGAKPALSGSVNVGPTHAKPVFQLMADAYLDPAYAPEAVAGALRASREDHPPHRRRARPRRLRADRSPCPARGPTSAAQRHETMTGRPVAFHAMRGISAHSNGFQTCRALHLLQLILGIGRDPRRLPLQAALPQARRRPPQARTTRSRPASRSTARTSAIRAARRISPSTPDGRPKRIDKAFSWEAPLAAHGMMHMVIANAVAGDPTPSRCLFLYMANMAWNSSMNTAGEHGDADRAPTPTGELPHPQDHRRRQLFLRDGRLRRPRAARHHLSRTPRLHQPARPADLRTRRRRRRHPLAGGRARAPRPRGRARLPVGPARPRRTASACPAWSTPTATPVFRDYADYMTRHQRRPGIGPLAGWRGDGTGAGPRRAQPRPDRPLHRERRLLAGARPRGGRLLQAVERRLPGLGGRHRPLRRAAALPLPALFRALGTFRPPPSARATASRPTTCATSLARAMAPLPVWYPAPLRGRPRPRRLPAPRHHPAPGGDVPFLALPERLAAPDPRGEPALRAAAPSGTPSASSPATGPRHLAARPHHRAGRAAWTPSNPHTVWTWNAIGKRPGAWALDPDAPEATRGFLLNHLIPELLPPQAATACAGRTPTPSPARPPGTTSACGSSASRRRRGAPRPSRRKPRRSAGAPSSSPSGAGGTADDSR